jgi:hypothetical protein
MNFILEDVAKWSESHGLKLNSSKTQAMLIATPNTHKLIDHQNLTKLTLNGTDITYFDTVKNLGITFDKHLNWDKQISSVSQFNSFLFLHKQVNTLVNIIRKITLMEKKGICRTSEQLTETRSQKINKKC